MDIFSLSEQIRRCTACPLWKGRTLAVPGEGAKDVGIMFIGEAPGSEEDRQGVPFVGRSGKFLDFLLGIIELKREDVFMTSIVKCRPPKNRMPSVNEIKKCQELWLKKQIDVLNPRLIVLLGKVSSNALLGKIDIEQFHGKIIEKEGRKYFVSYHPAAGMRFPKIKALMKEDFKKLNKIILQGNLFKIGLF
ncbi:uracil-DNA glycosylase [Candidatus Woesearchaeota archaeon]|nr:uracil-DNA glycosylase [Candidatus Woesearchaeota archaeon]